MEEDFKIINEAIYTDFGNEISEPLIECITDSHITNFFRNNPYRKIFILSSDAFDDEECSEDEWNERESDCSVAFDEALPIAENIWGKSKEDDAFFYDNAIFYDFEDESKKGTYLNDIEWSPECEEGATLTADVEQIAYWIINNRFVVLQKALNYADGRVDANVFVTISPMSSDV